MEDIFLNNNDMHNSNVLENNSNNTDTSYKPISVDNNAIAMAPDSVMILPEAVEKSKKVFALKLRHPHTKSGIMFLLDYENKKIYELNSIEAGKRSFFINENVMSNGDITLATPFDPIYLLLPYMMQATQNTPIEDLLQDEKFPKMAEIVQFCGDLSCIADKIGSPDLNVWKYNEELTLKLLEERINKLKALLQKNNEQIVISNYKKKLDSVTYLRMAFGILSEYLCEELSQKLKLHLKIPEEPKVEGHTTKNNKKLCVSEPSDDFSKDKLDVKAKVNQSAKEKALAKSAKGSKSITSFFTKK